MIFELVFTNKASEHIDLLEKSKDKRDIVRAVKKTLGLMETNLKHPSLQTHGYTSLKGESGEKVLESYVQNHTPGAYRIFWHYGPKKKVVTIVAIVPHQ